MSKKKLIGFIALLPLVLGVIYFGHASHEYETASDLGFTEFKDSDSNAIFDRGEIAKIRKTTELDSIFSTVLDSKIHATVHTDIFSRDVLRRRSDMLSIRFGETRECERALIYDDNTVVCDLELYFKLSDAIDSSSTAK